MKATIVRSRVWIFTLVCVASGSWGLMHQQDVRAAADDPANLEFFESKVRPLLAEHCQKCHGAEKQKGGLRLDSRTALLKGGDNGPAAISGDPAQSLLVQAVGYAEDLQMPPKSKLSAGDVATLAKWVEMGLPWPQTAGSASGNVKAAFDLQARKAAHWAWKPVQSPAVPQVERKDWPRDPADAFILAQLEAKGLAPAADADKRALIRRATFDLTGLPPTPAEVDAFASDNDPKAFEKVVDRLLASPRYGERWARHWLDLVRYGETRGHEFDPSIPNAYRYRDYVIRAFNADVPYNQFVIEHLAGDLMPNPRIDPKTGVNESLLGTGFWFLGEEVHSPVDIRQDEADRFDNRIDVMAKSFLGLTVACARCHDHKFDAISQRDYYAFSGFLASSGYRQARYATDAADKAIAHEFDALNTEVNSKLGPLIAAAVAPVVDSLDQTLLAARSALRDPRVVASEAAQPWVTELQKAKEDASHPMHLFARLSVDASASSESPQGLQAWITTQIEADQAKAKPVGDSSDRGFGRVIVDYRKPSSLAKLQDGYSFGLRSRQAGEVVLESGPKGETNLYVQAAPAAVQEPSWLKAPNTARNVSDQGRIGSWNRPGKTLRTPEFRIQSGTLWYLVQGPGHAYSVVDSHLMIVGPLHNALLLDWGGETPKWRWVRHDLKDYRGFRTHVELSANGTEPLSVAMIVDSETEPPAVFDSPSQTLREALAKPSVDSTEAMAQTYREIFKQAVTRLGGEGFQGSDDLARLASWVVQSRRLFLRDNDEHRVLQAEIERLFKEHEAIAARIPKESPTAPAMFEGTAFDESLLIRGSAKTPGAVVPRRFLEAISGDQPIADSEGGSGRLALAERIVDPAEPFASRVIVNRVWYHLFGRGIVASTDNFGMLGERPTHPELLDFLADRFVKEGWSIKRLIRELMLSRTYAMSSKLDASVDALDPNNLLLHRMPVRRLEAEPIRDAILAVSGRLNETMYGPSIPVHLTPFMEGRGRPGQSGPIDGDGRRSLYLEIRRNFLAPMMLAFDAPIPAGAIGRRNVSNVPAQALILMNDPFVVAQAALWAKRVLKEGDRTVEDRVEGLYKTAFSRSATAEERTLAIDFLKEQANEYQLPPDGWKTDKRPWADLCHVLINSKEFIYID